MSKAPFKRIQIGMLLCWLLSVPTVVLAQLGQAPLPSAASPSGTGPSLEQAQSWLKQKYREITPDDNSYQRTRLGVEFDGCTMYILRITKNTGADQRWYLTDVKTIKVPMKDIDPEKPFMTIGKEEKLTVSELNVQQTRANAAIFERAFDGDNGALDQAMRIAMGNASFYKMTTNMWGLTALSFVRDSTLQNRLHNALSHIANICAARETERLKATTKRLPGEAF